MNVKEPHPHMFFLFYNPDMKIPFLAQDNFKSRADTVACIKICFANTNS